MNIKYAAACGRAKRFNLNAALYELRLAARLVKARQITPEWLIELTEFYTCTVHKSRLDRDSGA